MCEGLLGPDGIRLSDEYCDSLGHDQDGDFTNDWAQGGPIIEREICELTKCGEPVYWEARAGFEGEPGHAVATGTTPLIAAMRCYVASKMGDEIDVPKELTCEPTK